MNNSNTLSSLRSLLILLAAALLALSGQPLRAQNIQHLSITQPGGMPGLPVITGFGPASNSHNYTLTWDGPSGYYQVFQRSATGTTFQALGPATNLTRRATISAIYSNAFFKVSGPAPRYAGSATCTECHAKTHNTVMYTRHTQAFQALKRVHQDTNRSCLPCHTVGYGLPTGFVNETTTPQLAGVQCENCHGPAANHAARETDPTVRPRAEVAATMCGGCHSSANHEPLYEDWHSSSHSGVVEDMNPTNRIDTCGRCHSGTVRLAMFQGKPLPVGDANIGVVCITCHDPHQTNAYPAQVRNPLFSTNDYSISTTGLLTNQYNPKINLCAQCHNRRGATWTNTSRPPHHSPQYNMLLGTVGELSSGQPHYDPGTHASLSNQCVTCHMQTTATQTGHQFQVNTFGVCLECHPLPEALVDFTQGAVSTQIQQVKALLDYWALNKAPAALRDRYGALAWEYTTPGELSSGTAGPNDAEQAQIPDAIKKARFNLYLVQNDGSFGVHNPDYVITLLETASDFVQSALNQP